MVKIMSEKTSKKKWMKLSIIIFYFFSFPRVTGKFPLIYFYSFPQISLSAGLVSRNSLFALETFLPSFNICVTKPVCQECSWLTCYDRAVNTTRVSLAQFKLIYICAASNNPLPPSPHLLLFIRSFCLFTPLRPI